MYSVLRFNVFFFVTWLNLQIMSVKIVLKCSITNQDFKSVHVYTASAFFPFLSCPSKILLSAGWGAVRYFLI